MGVRVAVHGCGHGDLDAIYTEVCLLSVIVFVMSTYILVYAINPHSILNFYFCS